MTFFISIAALCFITYYQSEKRRYLILCGILVGISMLFKQAAVLVLFGLLFYYLLKPSTKNLKNLILLLSGTTVPIIITLLFFYLKGGIADMIFSIITLNTGFYRFSSIYELLYFNIFVNIMMFPLLWALSISAGIIAIGEYIKYRRTTPSYLLRLRCCFYLE